MSPPDYIFGQTQGLPLHIVCPVALPRVISVGNRFIRQPLNSSVRIIKAIHITAVKRGDLEKPDLWYDIHGHVQFQDRWHNLEDYRRKRFRRSCRCAYRATRAAKSDGEAPQPSGQVAWLIAGSYSESILVKAYAELQRHSNRRMRETRSIPRTHLALSTLRLRLVYLRAAASLCS